MIPPETTFVYGKHALEEAIAHAKQAIEKVYFASYFDDETLLHNAKKAKLPIEFLPPGKLPKGFNDEGAGAHQGVFVLMNISKIVLPYKEFLENLEVGPDTSIVLLGELQDPQNVGAVIRSAAAFGVTAVLIPEHNQAPISGTVVKVSAGMAFRIPLISIGNVNTVIRDLKEKRFFVYGLEGEAKHTVTKEVFDSPSLFVLGNEATGIREKTRELCDKLISIPINPRCESLNAAASTAVALYAWSAQHPKAVSKFK